jgi:hypothetical protein
MNIKTQIISLSTIAIVTLCVLNVTAASTSNMATAAHSEYATGTTAQQETSLGIGLVDQNFKPTNTTKVGQPVDLIGLLMYPSGDPNAPNYIENARVTIQQLSANGTWIPIGTATTETGELKGTFVMLLTPRAAGFNIYRATYDGDSQFAHSVSNVVVLTVY